MVLGPRFRHFEDARRYVDEHRYAASLAVRGPDGDWEYVAPRTREYSSRAIQQSRVVQRERERRPGADAVLEHYVTTQPRASVRVLGTGNIGIEQVRQDIAVDGRSGVGDARSDVVSVQPANDGDDIGPVEPKHHDAGDLAVAS